MSHRTQELGIRSALGAGHFNLFALVVRQGMTLTCVGIGILLAAVLLRELRAVLYGVGFTDLPVFGIVSALLLAVALSPLMYPPGGRLRSIPWSRCASSEDELQALELRYSVREFRRSSWMEAEVGLRGNAHCESTSGQEPEEECRGEWF